MHEEEGEHRGEDRRRSLEQRCRPGVDPGLAPREEPERDRHVQDRGEQKRPEIRAQGTPGFSHASAQHHDHSQRRNGEDEPAEHERLRVEAAIGDLDEHERGAPDRREENQHRYMAAAHLCQNAEPGRRVPRLDSGP